MTTYPLPTLGPTIGPAGISIPAYSDIYTSFQASSQTIYGSDEYINPDSQDGQLLAIVAQAVSDGNNACVATYNQFSPTTAQGAGLSSIVKINGLKRDIPSNSTVDVTIAGTVGTVITNGVAGDTNGNQWNLPPSVTIPGSGSIVETATAANPGAITAESGTVINIITSTRGWLSVTNTDAAVPGAPVEEDPTLRERQSVSTGLPAQTVLEAIVAAIANISGVQKYKAYQNDTGSADGNGIPARSISLVVEGGDAVAIATAIAQKKSPGTGTYGTTTEVIIDSVGVPNTIHFYVPTQITILVNITIAPLAGYVSTTGTAIIANIVNFINGLGIGGNNGLLSLSSLYGPALNTGLSNTYNITALTIAISPGSPASSDLTIAFNDLPICATSNVILTVT